MSITENKITQWTNPVAGEVDRPQHTAAAMKAIFDSNSNQIKEALNALIDALAGTGGAGEIGADVDGLDGATVAENLAALKILTDRVKTDQGDTKFLSGEGTYKVPLIGQSANGLPSGGDDGDLLTKAGTVDFAANWTPATYFAAADHNHDGVYATPMQPQTVELTVAGWVENTQTVNVEGVTDENIIVVSPAPASLETYAAAGVYCSAQGAGTLTFACSAVPDAAVSVNVLVNMVGGGGGGVAVEVDPTVPLWAKAVAAPAYTAEDVGAVDADDEMSNLELLQLWNA